MARRRPSSDPQITMEKALMSARRKSKDKRFKFARSVLIKLAGKQGIEEHYKKIMSIYDKEREAIE